jgi:hypothetical protein
MADAVRLGKRTGATTVHLGVITTPAVAPRQPVVLLRPIVAAAH